MFLRRALRYRWSQALVLAGVSLLIGTCAAFAPWYARAVEQTVNTETLANRAVAAAWQVDARPLSQDDPVVPPEKLVDLIPADVKPLFTPPLLGMAGGLSWGLQGHKSEIVGDLIWQDGFCAQLTMIQGRCPKSPYEIVVSATDQKAYEAAVGKRLAVRSGVFDKPGTLTVVGVYRPVDPQGSYWFGRSPIGHSRPPHGNEPAYSDALFTDRSTFTTSNWYHDSTMDLRPQPGVAHLDDLARLEAATDQVKVAAHELNAQVQSSLPDVIDTIHAERKQARTIIPLVMVQVALFGVVVLALASAAVVDQRRPELALARLRGTSARRTGRALATELSVAVLCGSLAGLGVAFGVLALIRSTWLAGGAPIELPWQVLGALMVAAVISVGVVVLAVRSAVRQPISALLRRVVRLGRGRSLGMIDVIIVVLAVSGLATALTGGGRGPFPVLTPTLLALAAGLVFAHLLLPTAGLISRRAMRSGRLGLALGALQVSRRPAVTRIVAVVAVAAALVSFAGQAASVASDNRVMRAGYEIGAEAVVGVNTATLAEFTTALNKVDPDRRWLTPVVLTRADSPEALRTMMIEPDSFRRNAFRGDQLTDAAGFAALQASSVKPIEIRGTKLLATVETGPMTPVLPETSDGTTPPPQPAARSVVLEAKVVSRRSGARFLVTFPAVPLVPGKQFQLSADLGCTDGCQLLRLGVTREVNDSSGIRGSVIIHKLAVAGQPAIQLGKSEDWVATTQQSTAQQSTAQQSTGQQSIAAQDSADGLALEITNTGGEQELQHASLPPAVPALIGSNERVVDALSSPGLDGTATPLRKIGPLAHPINRYPVPTAVVDVETMRRLGGSLNEGATSFEIWLNADGLANLATIEEGLAQNGFSTQPPDRAADRIKSYSRSASALALQLTPVVGIAGWALAIIVLLLMVVTSWRSRAQDYASLRLSGVPVGTTGQAARWEQTGPVALAVLLGSVCGVVGARIALPLIPLFPQTRETSPVPLELTTNWGVALSQWLVSTLVLTSTTLLLGTGVNRRAIYTRIREDLA